MIEECEDGSRWSAIAAGVRSRRRARARARGSRPPARLPRAPGRAPPRHTRPHVAVRSNGFDWGDAGLGAAGVLSLLGLGTGALVIARRGRPTVT